MPRVTKLTPEVHESIVKSLRMGGYLETAAAAAGVPSRSVRDWLRKGAEQPKSIYGRFRSDVMQASAEAEQRGVAGLIRAANNGSVKALTWFLERRYPKKWGLKIRHYVQQEVDAAVERVAALEAELGPAVIDRVLEAIAGEDGSEEASGEES